MKLKINWVELGKQLWAAVKPVLLGALGGGLVAVTGGCSSLTPSTKTQAQTVMAIGLPGIAFITSTGQNATYPGGDTNAVSQANPANVTTPVFIGK